MTLEQGCNVCVVGGLTYWAIRAGRHILSGGRDAVDFLILMHFMFSGIPALLDLVVGRPVYFIYVSYRELQYDPLVGVIYAAYVILAPAIWWRWGKAQHEGRLTVAKTGSAGRRANAVHRLRPMLYVLAISPIILLSGAPDPLFYFRYGAIIESSVNSEMVKYHSWVAMATLLSVFAITAIWYSSRSVWRSIILWMPFLLASIWLNGKRHIVALAFLCLLIIFKERKVVSGWKLAGIVVVSITAFGSYSYWYQAGLRSTNLWQAAAEYDAVRIDYGRDHGIKWAILCELHPERGYILDYRAESVLFDLVMLVPRQVWPDKPWPYEVYATASSLGIPVSDLGWGITTSWLDEAIANFSWFGLIIGPLALAGICRVGDGCGALCRFLTILMSCLMLAVQISAFPILPALWLCTVFMHLWKSRTRSAGKGLGLSYYLAERTGVPWRLLAHPPGQN